MSCDNHTKITIKCKHCGKLVNVRTQATMKVFCSYSCNTSYNNKIHKLGTVFSRKYEHLSYINYNDKKGKKIRMSCKICGADRGYQSIADHNHPCIKCSIAKKKMYTPEQRRLRSSAKSNINSRLRRHVTGKCFRGAIRHLDYSFFDLIAHLESHFKDGMTWDNYGGRDGWQVDHSKPDSWFDYESPEDQGFKDSWALDNLRPMWASENKTKGNRYESK